MRAALETPGWILAARNVFRIMEAAGLCQIACSTSAIGCKSVTNRKSLSKKLTNAPTHPP